MTTKELFLNKQLSHQNESNHQFLNLNLNQNNKCSDTVSSLQSFSKSNNNKGYELQPFVVSGYTSTENYQEKNKSKLTFKTSKNPCSINDFKENERKHKRWMNDKNDCPINIYNSTLSLHIAAYENSIDSSSSIEEIKDLSKKSKAIKKTSPSKFQTNQDLFEFPRQMECSEQNPPLFMQFKASQKLFLPIQDASSSNQILLPPDVIIKLVLIACSFIFHFGLIVAALIGCGSKNARSVTTSATDGGKTPILRKMGLSGSKEFHEKETGINDSELKKVSYEPQPPDVFDDLDTDNDQKGKVAVDHIFKPTREVYGHPSKDLNDYLIDWGSEYRIALKKRPLPSDFPAFAHEKPQEKAA